LFPAKAHFLIGFYARRELEFYRWDRDVKEILGEVRETIDEVAKEWPREEKDDCLKETQLAFSYSGTVLGNLAKA